MYPFYTIRTSNTHSDSPGIGELFYCPDLIIKHSSLVRFGLKTLPLPGKTEKTQLDSRLKKADNPFKLLIIDDDKKVLDTLYGFLTDIKYDVVYASDGQEGMKLLESEQQGFDLVITDLVMPKISRNYLILMIKKEFPDMPVIAMTGWHAYPDAFVQEAQADRVLEKPFDLSELEKTIKELLSSQKHKVKN